MELRLHRVVRATSSLSVRYHPRCIFARDLHSSPTTAATPLATLAGPPPQAPQPSAYYPQDRLARKRQQVEALRQSREAKVNPSKPTTTLKKRFWTDVHVKSINDEYEIHLDTRPVRTASREVLKLPRSKRALAAAVAVEWDQLVSAQQAIKQHYVPLTSLLSRAVDVRNSDKQFGPTENPIRENIVKMAMRYLSTDTLLCWAPEKNIHDPDEARGGKTLRQRQRDVAEPIIAYLTTQIFPGIEIVPILGEDSIIPTSQPDVTRGVIRGWVSGLPVYELAALERAILGTKSLLIAARLVVEWSEEFAHLRSGKEESDIQIDDDRFDIEKAAEAANLEVLHQTERWGEVEDTHDVDKEDVRRQLGAAVLLVS